jgi:hypothetical protein
VKGRGKNGIRLIPGTDVGTKTIDEEPVIIDNLLNQNYIRFYENSYGIWIPADQILKRNNYEWFARLSAKQVLQSNTIIGNYLLLTNSPDGQTGVLEPLAPSQNKQIKNEFVGFWRVPSQAPYYGLKPNFLGDNLQKKGFPNR